MGWLGFGNNKSASAGERKKEGAESRAEDQQLTDEKAVGMKSASPSIVPQAAPSAPLPPPSETSVFEFGSAVNSEDRVTLAGYCSVSADLEPCQWEILPSGGGSYKYEIAVYVTHVDVVLSLIPRPIFSGAPGMCMM